VAVQQKYSYDLTYQLGILKLMARDPSFLKLHPDVVQPRFFILDTHMQVAQILLGFFKKHAESPSYDSMRKEMGDYFLSFNTRDETKQEIHRVVEQIYREEITNRDAIMQSVCYFAQSSSLRSAMKNVLDLIDQQGPLDEAEILVRKALAVGSRQTESWSFFEKIQGFRDRMIADRAYYPKFKIKTYFPSLDRATHGGIGAGQIWVVAARPKRGKSTLMVNLGASAIYQGKTVVHFSFGDMTKMDVMVKYAQRFSGMTAEQIMQGYDVESFCDKIVQAQPSACLEIIYDSPGVVGVPEMHATLGQLKVIRGINPDLVIVDYANKMKKPVQDNSYLSMSLIYDQLKALADDYECAILTGTQLRRKSGKDGDAGEGDTEEVAESYAQVADCDLMMFIHQTQSDEAQGNKATLNVSVNRRGEAVKVPVVFKKAIALFKETLGR